jgi:hypothetical protein
MEEGGVVMRGVSKRICDKEALFVCEKLET